MNPERGITTLAIQADGLEKMVAFSLEERELGETWQLSPIKYRDTLKRK